MLLLYNIYIWLLKWGANILENDTSILFLLSVFWIVGRMCIHQISTFLNTLCWCYHPLYGYNKILMLWPCGVRIKPNCLTQHSKIYTSEWEWAGGLYTIVCACWFLIHPCVLVSWRTVKEPDLCWKESQCLT